MDKIICNPALVYIVITIIVLNVTILLKLSTNDLIITFSQLTSIIIVTLILMGICNISLQTSWIITTISLIITLSMIISMMVNRFTQEPI